MKLKAKRPIIYIKSLSLLFKFIIIKEKKLFLIQLLII